MPRARKSVDGEVPLRLLLHQLLAFLGGESAVQAHWNPIWVAARQVSTQCPSPLDRAHLLPLLCDHPRKLHIRLQQPEQLLQLGIVAPVRSERHPRAGDERVDELVRLQHAHDRLL